MPYAEIDEEGKRGLGVLKLSAGLGVGLNQPYRPRRTHPKSKAGCSLCKQRRIKCDEERPHCRQCSRRKVPCTYNQSKTANPAIRGTLKPTVLWPGAKSPDILVQRSTFFTVYDLDLLHHFVIAASSDTLQDGDVVHISQEVPRMAFEHTHVMHVTLAVAAAHRRFRTGHANPSNEELGHWNKAISIFRDMLSNDWDQQADAVLTTSMFLSMLSFVDESLPPPKKSAVRELDSSSFSWFHVQIGLVELITLASIRASSNVIMPYFKDVDPDLSLLHDERSGTAGIPEHLVKLFDITEDSTCDNHPYLRLLRRVCHMSNVPKTTENALKFMQFMQGVDKGFVERLQRLDPRSIFLFGCWLGFLCHIDRWWCKGRAQNEFRAVGAYLQKHHPSLMPYLTSVIAY